MVIDLRVRPPFGSFLESFVYQEPAVIDEIEKATIRFGHNESIAIKEKSMDLFIREMEQSGIDRAVVPIPVRKTHRAANEDAVALAQKYPNKILSLAGIDPSDKKVALAEIEHYVVNGPCAGINMELAMIANPLHVNDKRLFDIYEKCQNDDVIVFFTFGGCFAAGLEYYNPFDVDDLARIFPRLKIVLGHAGWPYVASTCQVALENPYVYISPDVYLVNAPGSADYVTAANYLLQDKLMFGSAYPCASFDNILEKYREAGIREAVWTQVMGDNAAKLFGLQ